MKSDECTFSPGPSQLAPNMKRYLQDAVDEGLLSISHRSPRFSALYEEVIAGFQEKLDLPAGWSLYFLSSATECWQVLTQGLISENALHLYSGSFGERWHSYAQALLPGARGVSFGVNDPIEELQAQVLQPVEMLAFTHNETSNGSQVPLSFLQEVRAVLQEQLIAVDATSSMGGQVLPWQAADVWFASVQKCFGLPAGLCVLVASPQAQKRIARINNTTHYNGLARLHAHYENRQTSFTPNVLDIYLLSRVLADSSHIRQTDALLSARAQDYYQLVDAHPQLHAHVQRAANRSQTLICVEAEAAFMAQLHEQAQEKGLTLGGGYGPLKPNTFRIANFPALSQQVVDTLCDLLRVS